MQRPNVTLLPTLILFLLLSFIVKAKGQQIDSVLKKPVARFDKNDIQYLLAKGFISKSDISTMAVYLVDLSNKGMDPNHFTYEQLIDSLALRRRSINSEVVKLNSYGKDSVFIRTPSGEKYLLGFGEMTFEALEERVAKDLPMKYEGDLNLLFDSEKAAKVFATIQGKNEYSWISGNVLLLERDKGNIVKLRVGDVEEIARRIRFSREFAPFVNAFK